jgi:hypothetical protein
VDVDGDGTDDNGTDTDGDGIKDIADVDVDGDGIDDNGSDSDGDGINDANDPIDNLADADNDGLPDVIDPDDTNPDTDGDGIPDGADVDVDGDGNDDNGTDTDGDGVNDNADVDVNGDGIDDNGTDTDGDGINDFSDTVDNGLTSVFTGQTATGTGVATASIDNGGGPNCRFDPTNTGFIPVNTVSVTAPTTNDFIHGLFDFRLIQCAPGSTVEVTVHWPGDAFPTETQFWKYGPVSAGAGDSWFQPASVFINFATNETTFTVVNNGAGDSDSDTFTIVDPVGLAIPGNGVLPPTPGTPVKPIPTLSEWGRIILMLLIGVITLMQQGRRRKEVVRF